MRPNSPPQIDQRVVEHAALLQVVDQRGRGLVDFLGLHRDVVLDVAVVVPVAVVELDEPHAALGEPPREQAVGGERAVHALRRRTCRGRAGGSCEKSISSGTLVCILNAISYWLMRVAISGSSTQSGWLRGEGCHRVDHVALLAAADARRVAQVEDGVALGAELHALEPAGQESAVPLPRGDRLHLPAPAVRGEHDEARAGPSASLPRPYQIHEPMLGRPEIGCRCS